MSKRIADPGALNALRDQARGEVDLRAGAKEVRLTVHMGTCGIAAGARDVLARLMDELTRAGVQNVTLRHSGCAGLCDQEPMLTLTDAEGRDWRYGRIDAARVREIVQGHVLGGNPVTRLLINV